MTADGTAPVVLPNRRHRYRPPSLEAFASLTPSSEYWLGFLMADGCVSGSRETILVLHRRDADHVREFARFVGCDDRPLAPANQGAGVRLAIGSVGLARQLVTYGLAAGRGRDHDIPVQHELAESPHFWRGVVDGDGSLKVGASFPRPQLELVARPALAGQFARFLAPYVGFDLSPHPHSQSSRVLMVSAGGRSAKAAVAALYGVRPRPVLARKADRAAEILAWEPQVVHRYPWSTWANGREWILDRGRDYVEARRLWEAGRRYARHNALRLELEDHGSHVRLRFVPRPAGRLAS